MTPLPDFRIFFPGQPISLLASSYRQNTMKRTIFIFSLGLLVTCNSMAQKQGSVPARSLTEKGAQGDIVLGQENKKRQLLAKPVMLISADSSQKKKTHQRRRTGAIVK